MVKIIVGASSQEFNMHKGLLCDISPYFEACLKGNFKEAEEQTTKMPDEDAEVFKYFQHWAYTDCIIAESETESDIEGKLLIQLYIFAEACCIPRLQNAMIDVLIDRMATLNAIPLQALDFIYANTADTCCGDYSSRKLLLPVIFTMACGWREK